MPSSFSCFSDIYSSHHICKKCSISRISEVSYGRLETKSLSLFLTCDFPFWKTVLCTVNIINKWTIMLNHFPRLFSRVFFYSSTTSFFFRKKRFIVRFPCHKDLFWSPLLQKKILFYYHNNITTAISILTGLTRQFFY